MEYLIIGILVIFVVSFLIRELIIYNDGKLDKSNYVPREEIITLLNKGAIYNNYYYCPNNEDRKEAYRTEYYIKDNIQAIYLDSKLIEWTDYNNSEKILLTGADETACPGRHDHDYRDARDEFCGKNCRQGLVFRRRQDFRANGRQNVLQKSAN